MSSSSSDAARDDVVSSPDLPPLAAPVAAAAAAAAASGGGGVGGGSGRRLPPPCWTHEETLALIEAYRDRWEALRKGNLRAADWDDVAGAVTARCGRFPTATHKSGVQCRHKIEKLRKRYRAERARSAGRSKGPKWPFFALLHDLAGGGAPDPSPNAIVKIKTKGPAATPSPAVSSPSSEDAVRSRSLHGLISNGGAGSGLRFTIPKGSRTRLAAARPERSSNEDDAESEAMEEVAAALRAVGEGFMRMEERRLELSVQMEKERMESEMKRTQTMLDAQQLVLEAFLSKQQQQHHKRAKLSPAMEED
ncbi:trihelix transcription factor ENAP1-like [Phragmites australis]|uniref:trihelix transcription factor ENAP1-like n=1 Tax=Phragmites australis TaxID=29695 RepID=UPI002D769B4F|nr:trihelix transcription factor ENAP1-like [Phragmites australis]